MRAFLRVLMLLTLSSVGSFSFATTLYSPLVPGVWHNGGYVEYPDGASACQPYVYGYVTGFTGLTNQHDSADGFVTYADCTGTNASNEPNYVFATVYSNKVCPAGYTRDSSKVSTDSQACYQEQQDTCADKQGQTLEWSAQCGLATCGDPQLVSPNTYTCNPFAITWLNNGNTSRSGCEVSILSAVPQGDEDHFVISGSPGTASPVICDYTGVYTGQPEPAGGGSNPGAGGGGSGDNNISDGSGGTGGTGGDGSGGTGGDGSGGTGGDGSGGTGGTGGDGSGGTGGDGSGGTGGTGSGGDGTDPNGTGSYGAGTCAAAPSCTGDPVQCGIIHQAWVDTCALMRLPTLEEKADVSAQGQQYQSDYDQRTAQYNQQVSSHFNSFMSSSSGTQYQGQCPSDKSFSFMGHTFILKVSDYCPYLRIFRFFVLAMAYLTAARVIFKAV